MKNENDLYINYKQENPIYSPGLSTYSLQGNPGEKGNPGNSVYFYPNTLNKNSQALSFVKESIRSNKLLYSLYNDINPHPYLVNDIIIDSCGDVYYIKTINNDNIELSDCVGNISPSCPLCVKAERDNDSNIKLIIDDNYTAEELQKEYVFNVSYSDSNEKAITIYDIDIENNNELSNSNETNTVYVEICSKTTGICNKYVLTPIIK